MLIYTDSPYAKQPEQQAQHVDSHEFVIKRFTYIPIYTYSNYKKLIIAVWGMYVDQTMHPCLFRCILTDAFGPMLR